MEKVQQLIPQYRDLQSLVHVLPPEYLGISAWEIPIGQHQDVMWSIVLAYLNPSPGYRWSNLGNRIKLLLKRRKVRKRFLKSLEKCNPFLPESWCVFDDSMMEIVNTFRLNVERFCKKKFQNHIPSTHDILTASSVLLSCSIIYLLEDNSKGRSDFKETVFPHLGKPKRSFGCLVIVNKLMESDGCTFNSFSFCITKELGIEKHTLALREIITKTKPVDSLHKVEKFVDDICSLPGVTENLIVAMVKSGKREVIPQLYKSPYVFLRLCNSQFQVNPMKEDSDGLSSLFYALILGKTDLIYFLYYQVTTNILSAKESSPHPVILDSLLNMKEHLDVLRVKSTSSLVKNKYEFKSRLNELSRFNSFQIELFQNVYLACPQTLDEARVNIKRQGICFILSILQTYEKYFNWRTAKNASTSDDFYLFKDYLKHADYFDHLDFCFAVMFLEKLHSLRREMQSLSKREYSEIESRIFFFIHRRRYLESENAEERKTLLHTVDRMTLFQERLALKEKLTSLKNYLENDDKKPVGVLDQNTRSMDSSSTENQCPSLISVNCIEIFKDNPEIYGEILLCRLKHYVYAAVSVSLNDIKAKFVIQRALYVLGENLQGSSFRSIQMLLTFFLPSKLLSDIIQIRNSLGQYSFLQLAYRSTAEENMFLLKEVQQELKKLFVFLLPVFLAHENMMENLSWKLIHQTNSVNGSLKLDTECREEISLLESDKMLQHSNDFYHTWKECFGQIYSKTLKLLRNRGYKFIHKTHGRWYKYLTSNLISLAEKKLSPINHCGSDGDLQKSSDISNYFWCWEFLLTYTVKDKSASNLRQNIFNFSYDKLLSSLKFVLEKLNDNSVHKYTRLQKVLKFVKLSNIKMDSTESIHSSKKFQFWTGNASKDKLLFLDRLELLNLQEKKAFEDHVKTRKRIFSNQSSSSEDYSSTIQFSFIEKFLSALTTGNKFLAPIEVRILQDDFESKFNESYFALLDIKKFLVNENIANKKGVLKAVNKLYLSTKNETMLKEDIEKKKPWSEVLEKTPVYYQFWEQAILSKEISHHTLGVLRENLKLSDGCMGILTKPTDKKGSGNKFEFYRNRIKNLKSILIDDNRDVLSKGENEKEELHFIEMLVRIFLNDPEVQVSVEMLLSDCMSVLNTLDLKELWIRLDNFMHGMYLRNVLAYGNNLYMDVPWRYFDSEDAPSELMRKVLMLIKDELVLDCIHELGQKTDGKFESVMSILVSDESDEMDIYRVKIKKCDQWESYVHLLPR